MLPRVPGPIIDPIAVFAATTEMMAAHNGWHDTLHAKANYVFDVKDFGAVGDGVTDDTAAIQAAIDAATNGGQVVLPPGVFSVATLSIPSSKVSVKGAGSILTKILHNTAAGPIVDFAAWSVSTNYLTTAQYGGFSIVGQGSDITEIGLNLDPDTGAIGVCRFDDIAIRGTGGPCLYAEYLYLSTIRDCIFARPDGIDAGHDVPYVELVASNGTRMLNCGFRSLTAEPDASAGMLRLTNSDTYRGHDIVVRECWTEFPHPSEVLIFCENDTCTFTDWSWFDMSVTNSAASWVHLAGNGNTWRSQIPGTHSGGGPVPYAGIKVSGDRNRIDGIKGYTGGGGANVVLEPGAEFNVVVAAGQVSGVPGNSAQMVDDRSGNQTNVVLDLTNGRALLTVLDGD